MKSKIIALGLFAFTVTTVILYPTFRNVEANTINTTNTITPIVMPQLDPLSNEKQKIEVVFVLDTTSSMSGMIQVAKEKIWSIASTMASAQSAPEIKMGLVAYRDRGDEFVTKVIDLSEDLDSMYATLMDFKAVGGGDGPESVNQALYDAVNKMSWSQDAGAYKVVFLVGDAPPHMDYENDVKYPQTLAVAKQRGIVVNSIQCGQNNLTNRNWIQIAQLGHGQYFQVSQSGNAVAISTPFDEKLARLSENLDKTRLYYGTEDVKEKKKHKLEAADKLHAAASVESRARRAVFNSSAGGKANLLGEGELVDDIASGRVDLSSIDSELLPEPMKAMAPEEQRKLITETTDKRDKLMGEMQALAQQRSDYLKKKVEESGGAKDSLDHKLYSTIKEQAEKKGLRYEADAPAY